jgi:hypothetical protein
MAYQSHHCSATLPCSVCLTVFLHTCLALSVLLPFMLCAPCPFNAPFLFCVFQLLHTASFYTPESLSTSLHLFSVLHIYTICAPSSSSMHSASACSSPCHGSAHRVVHCHSTFALLRSLKPQKENCISLLSIPHLLLISEFYLTLRILLVSHCAYCNFPFFTVQLIFHSEQPTTHSHCVFLLYTTTTSVTPQNPRTTRFLSLSNSRDSSSSLS